MHSDFSFVNWLRIRHSFYSISFQYHCSSNSIFQPRFNSKWNFNSASRDQCFDSRILKFGPNCYVGVAIRHQKIHHSIHCWRNYGNHCALGTPICNLCFWWRPRFYSCVDRNAGPLHASGTGALHCYWLVHLSDPWRSRVGRFYFSFQIHGAGALSCSYLPCYSAFCRVIYTFGLSLSVLKSSSLHHAGIMSWIVAKSDHKSPHLTLFYFLSSLAAWILLQPSLLYRASPQTQLRHQEWQKAFIDHHFWGFGLVWCSPAVSGNCRGIRFAFTWFAPTFNNNIFDFPNWLFQKSW